MLPFLCCSTRYRNKVSLPTLSISDSSLFNEVLDAFNCSMMLIGLITSSNEDNRLFSKNDEEVVVVLDEAPAK